MNENKIVYMTENDRLTHRRVNGIKTGYFSVHKKDELIARLAAYENSGLSPESVLKLTRQVQNNDEPSFPEKFVDEIADVLVGMQIQICALADRHGVARGKALAAASDGFIGVCTAIPEKNTAENWEKLIAETCAGLDDVFSEKNEVQNND